MSLETPILFIIFNRFDTTLRVFEKIKEQKPRKLFIACDGPRAAKPMETKIVNNLREVILQKTDWECEVKTLFRTENLGCGQAVHSAITWFFDHVDQGIILEDDCLPLDGFFSYCEEMLDYYKDDESIYQICGTNLQGGKKRGDGSYYFSNIALIWGWASWARAWRNYDFNMDDLSRFRSSNQIKNVLPDRKQQEYWLKTFERTKYTNLDTWDYQLVFTMFNKGGKCVVPNKNMISNIGFENFTGTHLFEKPYWYDDLTKSNNNIFPIVHPSKSSVDINADSFFFKKTVVHPFFRRVVNFAIRHIAGYKNRKLISCFNELTSSQNVTISNTASVFNKKKDKQQIVIGKGSRIAGKLAIGSSGSIVFGENCNFGHHSYIAAIENVTIGNYVFISNDVKITDSNVFEYARVLKEISSIANMIENPITQTDKTIAKPVKICDNVSIGFNVTIASGVTINEGAVIAAYSVVLEDVPSSALVEGYPAVVTQYMKH